MGTLNTAQIFFPADTAYASVSASSYANFTHAQDFSITFGVHLLRKENQTLVSKLASGVGYSVFFADGRFHFRLEHSSGASAMEVSVGDADEYADGLPHHVACVWEGTAGVGEENATVYINGVEVTDTRVVVSNTLASSIANGGFFQLSGAATTTDNIQSGMLSWVVLTDYALTSTEVADLYNGGDFASPFDVLSSDPIGFWLAEFGVEAFATVTDWRVKNLVPTGAALTFNKRADFSRSNLGMDASGSWAVSAENPGGISSRSLRGGGQLLTTNTNPSALDFDVGQSFTLAYWARETANVSALGPAKVDSTISGGRGFYSGMSTDGSFYLILAHTTSPSARCQNTSGAGGTNYADGGWHLVIASYLAISVGTVDESDIKIYVDNVDKTANDGINDFPASGGTFSAAVPFKYGAFGSTLVSPTTSFLTEMLVYNRVLSADERTALWNGGVPAWPADLFDPVLGPVHYQRPGEHFEHGDMSNMAGPGDIVDYGFGAVGGGSPNATYKMRARDSGRAPGSDYIFWARGGTSPDFAGAGYSGGSPTPLGVMVAGSAVLVDEL